MGRSVELRDVVPEIERFGTLATLITVGEQGHPHVGSVLVEVGEERLVVRVGPTTRPTWAAVPRSRSPGSRGAAAATTSSSWTGSPKRTGARDGDGLIPVRVEVRKAILHRLAGRTDAGPTCLPLRTGAGRA